MNKFVDSRFEVLLVYEFQTKVKNLHKFKLRLKKCLHKNSVLVVTRKLK